MYTETHHIDRCQIVGKPLSRRAVLRGISGQFGIDFEDILDMFLGGPRFLDRLSVKGLEGPLLDFQKDQKRIRVFRYQTGGEDIDQGIDGHGICLRYVGDAFTVVVNVIFTHGCCSRCGTNFDPIAGATQSEEAA